jgi:hypothetical protein
MARLQSGTRIYGNATIDTVLSIDGSNTANSNITGALRVAGGIGVKGNVFSSGIITGIDANLGNLVTANYFSGTLTTANQPNVTSVGNLLNLNVTGNVSAGNVSGTLLTGTLATAAQPNITSVGNLTVANVGTLTVSTLANITATTGATSTTTGALQVAGGLGVVGNIYGGDIYKNGVIVINANDTVDGGTY